MPCDTRPNLTEQAKQNQRRAIARLEGSLNAGTVTVQIGAQGAVAFRGWVDQDKDGLTDLCAYRRLAATNSPALRRALAAAEVRAGRKLDQRAVASGVHSHDGGGSWHGGHS